MNLISIQYKSAIAEETVASGWLYQLTLTFVRIINIFLFSVKQKYPFYEKKIAANLLNWFVFEWRIINYIVLIDS